MTYYLIPVEIEVEADGPAAAIEVIEALLRDMDLISEAFWATEKHIGPPRELVATEEEEE